MPVNTRGCREFVGDINTNAISLHTFEGRTMDLTVESPTKSPELFIPGGLGHKDMIHLFANQMKHLDPLHDAIRKSRSIEGDSWLIILARLSWRKGRFHPKRTLGILRRRQILRRSCRRR